MLQRVSGDGAGSSNEAGGRNVVDGSGQSTDDKCDGCDEDWFRDMARSLLGRKAGTHLWAITGIDERSCQRYAAGSVKPPAYFLRKLLRSEQGGTFLACLMQGAEPAWWIEHQRGRGAVNAIQDIQRRIAEFK